MIFHPNLQNLMIGRGVLAAFGEQFAISVFGGTQPLAADIVANWSNYGSSVLGHYTGFSGVQPQDGIMMTVSGPVTASGITSGLATWGILWTTNVQVADLSNPTIPQGSFVVGPVTTADSDGMIRMLDTNIAQNTNSTVQDMSLTATF